MALIDDIRPIRDNLLAAAEELANVIGQPWLASYAETVSGIFDDLFGPSPAMRAAGAADGGCPVKACFARANAEPATALPGWLTTFLQSALAALLKILVPAAA